ncbi:uncharacterized protein BDCG_03606 [Blastomyces dermatitidis ER-3]|uniref:Uncharacterized protein n=1 Tax=Ajellomyces dermatitidis (strain ER-3 / ATCC MYA-2586) TaxID=559297 RepID=A0ABP2EWP1_AJEDR|nr:uncharacterized protein BDCG_03606 [Blastomyces dermatitidis ER-3]EEQ88486.2 hypothetical protein BDCG_03606 [Blastomyces dermatitidis ER-3]EQL38556.1 hypothetical protein BDFG_00135 [Blastomyces dermatitidis ATCC 26199]EQL38557.1 hypothetical protein, variant [Blastomyces dermatitidis ATCC 26199]
MSEPEPLKLTEERLAMHNKLYKPSLETHCRHASQLVEMERMSMGLLPLDTDSLNKEHCSTSSLPTELPFSQTSGLLTGSFGSTNGPLKKSPLEHPLERLLTPGDLSEPIYFARQALKQYGFEYGSRASVDARKKLGRLNYESTKSTAKAAVTDKNDRSNRKS